MVPPCNALIFRLTEMNILAVQLMILLAHAAACFGVAMRSIPFHLLPMPYVLAWSVRLMKDSVCLWLPGCFTQIIQKQLEYVRVLFQMGSRKE